MGNAIEVRNLKKKYGDFYALDGLDLNVEQGKIYGFLGKNGAGKTTAIRIILKHIKATEGDIKIFGTSEKNYLKESSKFFGSLVESPASYANLTAYENLKITTKLYGVGHECVTETLEKVGLSPTLKRKVKKYSLGMKQRLGIAQAIIHNPKILILDEPTNGLDPQGIKEMRELFRGLCEKQGTTILVSSHILSEIQQIADVVGIINNGKMVGEFKIGELEKTGQQFLILETDDIVKTQTILKVMKKEFSFIENDRIKIDCSRNENIEINRKMIQAGVGIYSAEVVSNNLEEIFLSLTDIEDKITGVNRGKVA